MSRQLHIAVTLICTLCIALAVCGAASAYDFPDTSQHTNYRPGYVGGCSVGAACHSVAAGAFLPESITGTASVDYTNFCLSCHNASGEAHDRKAGSASTNAYVNFTGLGPGPFDGDSHSWNGINGNAGTQTPTLGSMAGTGHMPGGDKVTCQTCHQGMSKVREDDIKWIEATSGDELSYTMLGYSTTQQYLSHYVRVYRASTDTPAPTNSRTKLGYRVDPSEYSYDYSTATVTFLTAQDPGDKIYVDITQPYFREGNAGNAMCLDCHFDRTDSAVSHSPGAGATDHHPVVVDYAHTSGLHDTLKADADTSVYIEGGQVLCTSCHDVHNAASDDGQLTRSADSSELCTDCHETNGFDGISTALLANHDGSKHSAPTECLDCHTTHDTDNILLIKNSINGKAVSFRNFSGADSFGNDTGDSVCEACHTATDWHRSDGSLTGHNTGKNCTACHGHDTGFGGGGCTGCHGMPPVPGNAGPTGWADTTGDAHDTHVNIYLKGASFGLTGNAICSECHGAAIPRGDHSNKADGSGKDSAGMDTSTWGDWTGVGGDWGTPFFTYSSTTGKASTADDYCANVSCHSSASARTWTGGGGCDSCHGFPPTTSAHTVQYDSGITSHLVSASDPIYSNISTYGQSGWPCGKCHDNAPADHKKGYVSAGGGFAACGGGEFTINVNASGSDVTCSNVKCHSANTTTPNWY